MSLKAAPVLGVIRLDYDYPPACGDIDCPDTYGYDVYYKVVPGLTFEMAQMGKMTNAVQQRFIESCHWLIDEKKVNVITGDCGFMVYFQEVALSIAKSKPVCFVMSSLLQLKSIQATLSPNDEIFVLTANGVALGNMAPAFEAACGFSIVDPRVKIVGCEDVPGFEAVADGGKVNVAKVDPGIVALVNDKLKKNPKVKAILLECTELPPYANSLRASTGLPVWDVISACNYVVSSYLNEPRYGKQGWQAGWDGEQDAYKFGDNVKGSNKMYLVNKPATK